jgi:hypothetical protein
LRQRYIEIYRKRIGEIDRLREKELEEEIGRNRLKERRQMEREQEIDREILRQR